jgi:RNA polymerase sigma-70 factor, ECF subfamily
MASSQRLDTDAVRLSIVVLRAQAGDARAFGELIECFGERTLRYLRGLLGDAAEDVYQDVWLAVYRGLRTLANPRAFRTWLFSTTRHRALDYLRRRKRERELTADADVDSVADVAHDDAPIPCAELESAIAELSPLHREVVLLRYRDEMPYAEIALVIGCSIGTVRSRLHNAKRQLEERIKRGQR